MSAGARPWRSVGVAGAVERIPTMLSQEERQYLQWLTAERYEGWGTVVDLGPWLGSSTAALAEGLQKRGRGGKVHSFDLFQWEPSYMERSAGDRLSHGADFMPLFRREVEPWSDRIDARKEDLHESVWEGGPIEILFVDAAKSWDLLNAILRVFGPALLPGRSRVVLQDFRHFFTYWLPLVFCGRPDLWQEMESVKVGTTVTFSPRRDLHGAEISFPDDSDRDFPFALADSILRTRIQSEVGQARFFLELTLVYLTLLRREIPSFDQLRRSLFRAEPLEGGPAPGRGLSRAWAALEAGDLAAARLMGEQSVARNQNVPEACLLLGRVAQEAGLEPLSRELFNRGLELCFQGPRRLPGWAAFEDGELELARRQASSSMREYGETAETHFLLGRIAQEFGNFDEAEAAYSRALEIDPQSDLSRWFRSKLALSRGFAAFDAGNLEDAERLMTAFVEQQGETVESHFLHGRIAQERGRLGEAEQAFCRALEIDPQHSYSHKFLAQVRDHRKADGWVSA